MYGIGFFNDVSVYGDFIEKEGNLAVAKPKKKLCVYLYFVINILFSLS